MVERYDYKGSETYVGSIPAIPFHRIGCENKEKPCNPKNVYLRDMRFLVLWR